jgi:hypothetical protein
VDGLGDDAQTAGQHGTAYRAAQHVSAVGRQWRQPCR